MSDPKLDEQHESVWLLLPWHANGTLETAERRLVEDHLAGCPSCREEMARCNAFAAALRDREEIAPSPHPLQLARLMERIEASERGLDALSENGEGGEGGAYGEDRAAGDHRDHREHREHPAHGADGEEAAATSSLAGELAGETSAPVRNGMAGAAAAARSGRAGALPGVAAMPSGRADGRTSRTGGTGGSGGHRRGGERGTSLLGDTPRPVRWALAGQLAALVLLSAALAVGPARRFESGKLATPTSERPASPAGAVYHTLSAPSARAVSMAATSAASAAGAAAPEIRVMFAEAATEKQMREVLLSTRGRLVDGPSPLGAYTLELPAPAPATAAPPAGGSRGTWAGDAAPASPAPRASHAEAAPDSLGIVLAYLHSQPIVRFAEPVAGTGTPATSSPSPVAPGLGMAREAPQGTPEAPPP